MSPTRCPLSNLKTYNAVGSENSDGVDGGADSGVESFASAVVRRPDVGEFGEQVAVRSRVVRSYFAIREESMKYSTTLSVSSRPFVG
jgi:hypothetical protein